MSLPPLPTPAIHAPFFKEVRTVHQGDYYTAKQMQAFYKQGRAEALEEAAQVCSHKAETKRMFLNEAHYLECAEAIRSLK